MKYKPIVPAICLVLAAAWINVLHSQQAPLPEDILYSVVFRLVVTQEKFADRIAAKGKDSSTARSQIRRDAGLTDDEEKALKKAAAEYIGKQDKFFLDRTDVAKGAKDKDANEKEKAKQQIRALEKQNRDDLMEAVDKLKKTFGPARWQAFETFARTSLAKNVQTFGPEKGGK